MRAAGIATGSYAAAWLAMLGYPSGEFTASRIVLLWFASVGALGAGALVGRQRWGYAPAVAFLSAPLFLGLLQCGKRINYIIDYGGMDGGPELASPMAFLIGWTFELGALTVPATVLGIWLWRSRFRAARAA